MGVSELSYGMARFKADTHGDAKKAPVALRTTAAGLRRLMRIGPRNPLESEALRPFAGRLAAMKNRLTFLHEGGSAFDIVLGVEAGIDCPLGGRKDRGRRAP
jgi:hypothetical protein